MPCPPLPTAPCCQGLLKPDNLPAKSERALFETAFVFAMVWAFGGALCEKDGINYRCGAPCAQVAFRSPCAQLSAQEHFRAWAQCSLPQVGPTFVTPHAPAGSNLTSGGS